MTATVSTVYVAVPILRYPKPPKRKSASGMFLVRGALALEVSRDRRSSSRCRRGWGALRSYDCRSLMLRAGGGNAHGTQAARKRSGQRQHGKACPPSRLRQPTHDKENAIRYPLANGKVRLQA